MSVVLSRDYKIYPIRIPTPFAVGDVYCYLLDHEKKVLVDCGHYADGALSLIKTALKERGLGITDLDEIWLTHGHPDHFGQAARLADQSVSIAKGHPKEKSNFAGNSDRMLFADFFREHNIPERYVQLMIEQLDWLQQYQLPIEPEWVEDGERLTTGSMDFTAKHTPGHSPGHVCYYADEEIIFGGDLLLEHVSTNALINFDPDTEQRNRSLLQYRESLDWISQKAGVVLPGHGKQIFEINKIAGHHLSEHEKRYRKICKLLSNQSRSLLEIGIAMFSDAIDKDAIFLVLSEVLGYLDWGIEKETIGFDDKSQKYYLVNN